MFLNINIIQLIQMDQLNVLHPLFDIVSNKLFIYTCEVESITSINFPIEFNA